MSTLLASYSNTNQDAEIDVGTIARHGAGQSFVVPTGVNWMIDSVQFYLRIQASPTGNATVKLYAHSGTFGVNGVPTGLALATSSTLDVSTLTGSSVAYTFTFTGAEQYVLQSGQHYFVIFEYEGDDTNYVWLGYDTSTPGDAGNMAYSQDLISWTTFGGDASFAVYGSEDTSLLIDLTN